MENRTKVPRKNTSQAAGPLSFPLPLPAHGEATGGDKGESTWRGGPLLAAAAAAAGEVEKKKEEDEGLEEGEKEEERTVGG